MKLAVFPKPMCNRGFSKTELAELNPLAAVDQHTGDSAHLNIKKSKETTATGTSVLLNQPKTLYHQNKIDKPCSYSVTQLHSLCIYGQKQTSSTMSGVVYALFAGDYLQKHKARLTHCCQSLTWSHLSWRRWRFRCHWH